MIKDDYSGPLDEAQWPTRLKSRVLQRGAETRLHGYSIENDLAPNYTFSETVLLALTGALPNAEEGRAFEVACAFLARIHTSEAPVHAALLARICAATTSAITGTGAIALGEQARFEAARFVPFLAWLSEPTGPPPSEFTTVDPNELERVNGFRSALDAREGFSPRTISSDLDLDSAIVAVLFACGVRTREQLETVRVFARYPVLMAETLAAPPARYKDYPVTTPAIRYEEER